MKNFFREPLVHFLALGALLFAVAGWKGGSGPGSNRIVVSRGEIDRLTAGFQRTWQRPPSAPEMKGLLDDYVKEELAAREASAIGLDRDDTIIRRRLRQKFEFLAEDAAETSAPADAELLAYMAKHPDRFRAEPRVAFRQVYVNVSRRGSSARADAEKILERLRRAGAAAATDRIGDPTMLPADQPLAPVSDVVSSFGRDFAANLENVPQGRWEGPVESSFGLHLVFVSERTPASLPALAEVRPAVEREVVAERKKARLDALYAELLKKYRVRIEEPKAGPAGGAAR